MRRYLRLRWARTQQAEGIRTSGVCSWILSRESERRLLEDSESLEAAETFHELFELVESIIGSIYRIGELAVYDTALRIGVRLGLEPKKVYLHRGTRRGATALGLGRRRPWLHVSELPTELQVLS